MKIRIAPPVQSDQRWFPFLDAILLIVGSARHSFAIPHVPALLQSAWLNSRGRSAAELIKHSCLAAANDAFRNKIEIEIDDTVRRGGVCDRKACLTKIHPMDAISFLSQPYQLIVENEEFDGAFLFWMAKALGFERLLHAYRAGHFIFRHAGGKDSIPRSARVVCEGVWARNDRSHNRAFDHWLGVMLDNDSRFPGDDPNMQIVHEASKYAAYVHQLKKRSIESYIPAIKLRKFDSSPQFLQKVAALESFTQDQRAHFHMKRGFRFDKATIPTKTNYGAATEVSPEEKSLFSSVSDSVWNLIMDGFGKRLSEIFTDLQHRPNSNEAKLLPPADRAELESLIHAIYARI